MSRYHPNQPNSAVSPSSTFAAFANGAIDPVVALLRCCPRYSATPLITADPLARELGIGRLWIKDERTRLDATSFKALGGAYAVLAAAAERCGGLSIDHVIRDTLGRGMTVTAATAGNHGWSVAAGARLIGARSVIYVYDGVPEDQIDAIASAGAEIVRTPGGYDDAVAMCARDAQAHDRLLVSDSSWPGYRDIPLTVMQGYAVIADEIVAQSAVPPTHIMLQAGVGGLAAALVARLSACLGERAPRAIIVEPEGAACLIDSAIAGSPIAAHRQERTSMGRLECYQPSVVAHELLSALAWGYVTIGEEAAFAVVDMLADLGHPTSPSGAAGLGGLCAVASDQRFRQAAGLDVDSEVVIVLTEAATCEDLARIESRARRQPSRPPNPDALR